MLLLLHSDGNQSLNKAPFNKSLTISISYSGCSSAHSFTLKNRLSSSTAEIWLFKETKDEPCDGIIQEVRTFQLPQEISTSKSIVLITPVEENIVLK